MSHDHAAIAVSRSPFGKHKDGEASDMAAERGEIYEAYEAFYRFLPYLKTLRQHPHLKPYVHNFNLSGSRMMDGRGFRFIDHPVTSFRQTLQVLPALKNVTLFRPLFLSELDKIIHKLQQNGLEQPAFHLKYLECSTIEVFGMLKGSYRSFTTDDRTHCYKTHFDKVFNSVPSAKLHCSSDFGGIGLDKFSSVKTLELHATTYQKWIRGPPRPPFRHLHNSLSRSSTLETVIVSGLPSSALIELLSPSGIIGSLPPSVTTLSIDVPADIDTLVNLVQSLALSTGLKTLMIRSVEGDPTQLREKMSEESY